MRRKLTLALFTALLALAAQLSTGIAQAAPGTIFIQNTCSSASAQMVHWQNQITGTIADGAQPACTNYGEGSYSTANKDWEPLAFQVGPGWCARWSINDGPATVTQGGYSGVWQGVHPGSGYNGWWKISVTQYDC